MIRRLILLSVSLLGIAVSGPRTLADVRLPAVFGDHLVLQRDMPVPVWGWAEPGERVTVTFRDQSKSTTAADDGKWMVKLDPLSVGDPGALSIQGSSGDERVTFSDVLVGEVWVCSGQSNMKLTVQTAIDPDLESLAANHPHIRLFNVEQDTATEPAEDFKARWQLCSSDAVPSFSAVAYYFGRNLHEVLGVPIGLIETAWGGTRAEAWTSPEFMANVKELQPILDTWASRVETYDPAAAKQQYETALARWKERAAQARKAGRRVPRRPRPPSDPRVDRHHPSNLYNAMVAPLAGYAIRGAIWYQGEANAGRAYQYRTLMPTMIESWREAWGQGDFPFYIVQLANFREIKEEPGESDWAELREAQMLTTEKLPNVGVACITDIGAAKDIHPKNKQDVGKRLARLALVDNYGYEGKLVRQGPTFESMTVAGNKAILKFDNHGSPLIPYYREELRGFAVAGEDHQWRWAAAEITAPDTVTVSHPDVAQPVAVRYNWADNPQGNLYNTHYLPAYPFRTDDWPGVTVENVAP